VDGRVELSHALGGSSLLLELAHRALTRLVLEPRVLRLPLERRAFRLDELAADALRPAGIGVEREPRHHLRIARRRGEPLERALAALAVVLGPIPLARVVLRHRLRSRGERGERQTSSDGGCAL
jgi:hypothetical protein